MKKVSIVIIRFLSIAIIWLTLLYASVARGGLTLSTDTFTLSFTDDGRPDVCQRKPNGDQLITSGNGGWGFYLEGPGQEHTQLNSLFLQPDGYLVASSIDGSKKVLFRVRAGPFYIAFYIEKAIGIPPEHLESLHFQMNAKPDIRVTDLDYMTAVENRADSVVVNWDDFQHRSQQDPLGGFALYEKTNDDDEDSTLIRIWVGEGLPHPKVAGEWTEEAAHNWIRLWQNRFTDRSQMILAGKSLSELKEGVDFAASVGIKQIYLHMDTWSAATFWPVDKSNWAVNLSVFPRGETDLREFSDYVRSKGMYLALHHISGGIGLKDSVHVGHHPDNRLASWGKGTLLADVGPNDGTIILKPLDGPVPPFAHSPRYPSFFDTNVIRIDDEVVHVGQILPQSDGTWTLKNCNRGFGSTQASVHLKGQGCLGLFLAYGQVFIPDNDSTLLTELGENYAGLLNRCLVNHAEFDGAEINCPTGTWGYRKYSTVVYENLDHPTTAHDSRGSHPAAWFEYRLNSTQRLLLGSCSYTFGNYSVPILLASNSRPASTILDAEYVLSQGNQGGALGIGKPEPMFGVTTHALKTHGLTPQFLEALSDWENIDKQITQDQRERINSTFIRPEKQGQGRFNNHICSPIVPVAKKIGNNYEVVPTRVLNRATGDILWQEGQEHGPISPRQFVKLGDTLKLANPETAQPLQFIIHVLPAFNPKAPIIPAVKTAAQEKQAATEVFTSGNGSSQSEDNDNVNNVFLQPAKAEDIHSDGPTKVELTDESLLLTANNSGDELIDTDRLPSWNLAVDMSNRRGIGMWITGDNSGALLLVELGSRDYIVPINFNDRRYVEIPNGEVSWASSAWGWRMGTKSTDYSKVRTVRVGFGRLPARRQSSIKIEDLIALQEIHVALDSPLIQIGSHKWQVKGLIPSGDFLEYKGGDTSDLYHENWHKLAELRIEKNDGILPSGDLSIMISANSSQLTPWLDVQFIATGPPIPVGAATSHSIR